MDIFEKLVSQDPYPILRVNREGKILHANEAADGVLLEWGVGRGENLPESAMETLRETLRENVVGITEVDCAGMAVELRFIPDDDLGAASVYGRDISEIEVERLKTLKESKMASLGKMAGGVAHEINNPLMIIRGKAEQAKRILQREELDIPRAIQFIDKIEKTAERITKIVKGVRSFSRSGKDEPIQKISVPELVEQTLEFCRIKIAQRGIELRIRELSPNLKISCRVVQIQQVLLNLVINAADAVESSSSDERWLEIDAQEVGDQMMISVTDSGHGIPEELRKKVMDPFFTTKPVGSGTGLGLSISKEIVKKHNGDLTLDTDCPHTRFVVLLDKGLVERKEAA